jgi:hypothetical protein
VSRHVNRDILSNGIVFFQTQSQLLSEQKQQVFRKISYRNPMTVVLLRGAQVIVLVLLNSSGAMREFRLC